MMARAIELARRGLYTTRPNPTVGCVLVRGGEIVGEGATQPFGRPHAEVEALNRCDDPAGATAYVTLEPCAHFGKTPPCADALIAAGIARCVIAMRDPNPESGGGAARLEAAGIEVDIGLLASEAETVNAGFYRRMRAGRPLVRVKLAASLDGRTAMAGGESRWITGPPARADVQKLRGRSDAIVTGVGTVLGDDPALTVRDESLGLRAQPLRVVLDSRLRTPVRANLLRQPGATCIVHARGLAERADALAAAGAELQHLPGPDGRVDLARLVAGLGERQVNDVLVECGPRLAGAFAARGLVDELIVYLAPVLMGSDARPLLELPIARMEDRIELSIADVRKVGEDWRLTCLPVS